MMKCMSSKDNKHYVCPRTVQIVLFWDCCKYHAPYVLILNHKEVAVVCYLLNTVSSIASGYIAKYDCDPKLVTNWWFWLRKEWWRGLLVGKKMVAYDKERVVGGIVGREKVVFFGRKDQWLGSLL